MSQLHRILFESNRSTAVNKMKYFLSLVCILGFISFISADTAESPSTSAEIDHVHNISCFEDFNQTPENKMYSMHEIMNNTHTEPGNEEKNKNIGCLLECLLKEKGMMEGSNLIEEKINEKIEGITADSDVLPKVQDMLHKCINEAKDINSQECGKGFSMYTCIMKEMNTLKREHTSHESNEDDELELRKFCTKITGDTAHSGMFHVFCE